MSTEIKSTATGAIVGIVNMVITSNFLLTLSVAAGTGAAAYLGQYCMKLALAYVKKKIKR